MSDAPATEAPKVQMRCESCGSANVMRDAWAEWDVGTQTWVLRGEPFDMAYCEDCDGECSIEEVTVGLDAAKGAFLDNPSRANARALLDEADNYAGDGMISESEFEAIRRETAAHLMEATDE